MVEEVLDQWYGPQDAFYKGSPADRPEEQPSQSLNADFLLPAFASVKAMTSIFCTLKPQGLPWWPMAGVATLTTAPLCRTKFKRSTR